MCIDSNSAYIDSAKSHVRHARMMGREVSYKDLIKIPVCPDKDTGVRSTLQLPYSRSGMCTSKQHVHQSSGARVHTILMLESNLVAYMCVLQLSRVDEAAVVTIQTCTEVGIN